MKITWLHLTDLHRGMSSQQWLWPNVEQAFFEDLKKLHASHGLVDLIIFSGDFVQKGSAREYEHVNHTLGRLYEHLKILGSTPFLLGVPGNHDLVRPKPTKPEVRVLAGWENSSEVREEFWSQKNCSYRRLVNKSFENYSKWYLNHPFPRLPEKTGLLPGDFSVRFKKENLQLGVVGLNTTFLQLSAEKFDEKLAVHPAQLTAICGEDFGDWFQQNDFSFLVSHQPPDWLTPESRDHFDGEIALPGRFALHMFGHMHESQLSTVSIGGGSTRHRLQGSSLFGLEFYGERQQRLHGYSIGTLTFNSTNKSGMLRIFPRRAVKHQGKNWHFVSDSTFSLLDDGGTNEIELKAPDTTLDPPLVKGARNVSTIDTSVLFDPPQFSDCADRKELHRGLDASVSANSIVGVGGLSGSGKTYLVASYLNKQLKSGSITGVLWHDPCDRETLDAMLIKIAPRLPVQCTSPEDSCKHLLRLLSESNEILVVDDFHTVDQTSYATIVKLALRQRPPARVILVSQLYPGLFEGNPICHVDVVGFRYREMEKFLASRGLHDLSRRTIDDLIEKTDGLPYAASLFATLVTDFNRSASDLLKGSMVTEARFRTWFNEVLELTGTQGSKLLHMLSVCEGPFNYRTSQVLCRHQNLRDPDQLFEKLQECYLVEEYSRFRWNVHSLISKLCRGKLSDSEAREVHLVLASHYLSSSRYIAKRHSKENALIWQVRACKHFQYAQEYRRSKETIHLLIKHAKACGYYNLLIQLMEGEPDLARTDDGWLVYHYSHCCLITGEYRKSSDAVEPLLYEGQSLEPSLQLACVRLYAEALEVQGDLSTALQKLEEGIQKIGSKLVKATVFSHAKGVQARLLTGLKEYSRAERLCEELVRDAKANSVGRAVALTQHGIICNATDRAATALEKLNEATTIFAACNDRRGSAWSLCNLAISHLCLGDRAEVEKNLGKAMRIKAQIGETFPDYVKILRHVRGDLRDGRIVVDINKELQRLGGT